MNTPVPKCWEYELPGGFKAYAGKTDADNDQLSLRFARANDYWFHVKGMPGSHVILRVEDAEPERTSQRTDEEKDPVAPPPTPISIHEGRTISNSPDDVGARLGESDQRISGFFEIGPLSNLHHRWEGVTDDLRKRFGRKASGKMM